MVGSSHGGLADQSEVLHRSIVLSPFLSWLVGSVCSRPTCTQSGCPPVSVCLSMAKCHLKSLVAVGTDVFWLEWHQVWVLLPLGLIVFQALVREWVWGLWHLLPRPQGIVELMIFLHRLACLVPHLASHPGDCTTSVYLQGLSRGRVNWWFSPFKSGSFKRVKVTCVPNLHSKSVPNKSTGHSGSIEIHESLAIPPSDIFGVGRKI